MDLGSALDVHHAPKLPVKTEATSLRQAVLLCSEYVSTAAIVLSDEVIMPFRFRNCMIFLSKIGDQLQVDVAVSEPLFLDYEIKSLHLNSRFVVKEMVAAAMGLYGVNAGQSFAMPFLFKDGCGFVKFEQGNDYQVDLIERVPVTFECQIEFAKIGE